MTLISIEHGMKEETSQLTISDRYQINRYFKYVYYDLQQMGKFLQINPILKKHFP